MYLFLCYDKYIKSNQTDLDMIETYKNPLKKMEAVFDEKRTQETKMCKDLKQIV